MAADGVTAVCAQSEETGFIVLQDIWDANLHCPDDLAVIASSPTRCRERSACGCGNRFRLRLWDTKSGQPVGQPRGCGTNCSGSRRSTHRLEPVSVRGGRDAPGNEHSTDMSLSVEKVAQRTRTVKRKTCHAHGGAVGVWSATHFRGVVILSLHPIVLSDVRRGVVHPLRRSRGCAEGGAGNRLTRDARTDNCVGRGHRAQGAIPATADSPSEKLIAKAANGPARHR